MVPTSVVGNDRLVLESVASGAAPVPLRVMVCVAELAPPLLSVMVMVAEYDAAVGGAKVVEMVHELFAASALPQVLVTGKLVALVPVTVMLATVSVALPVLARVTVCAAAVWPGVAVKVSEDADSEACGLLDPPPPEPVLEPLPQPVRTNAKAKKATSKNEDLESMYDPGYEMGNDDYSGRYRNARRLCATNFCSRRKAAWQPRLMPS